VEKARVAFVRKWKLRCKAVTTSFEEAGDDLFTFLRYPASQWKRLRTTNALERLNEEFRRRTKTQASLPSEDAVLLLLFGLLRTGQVVFRRIVGCQDTPTVRQQEVERGIGGRAAITHQLVNCRTMRLSDFPPLDRHHC
jgi:hypothetical protein